MNLSEEYISILFRLINFGTVVFGGWYFYTYYVCDAVDEQIEQDEKTLAMLAQQKDAFHKQEQAVEHEIQEQKKTIADLVRALKMWQENASKERESDRNRYAAIQEKVNKKMRVQSKNMQEHMIAKQAIPIALHELEMSLSTYFKDEKRGREYLGPLFKQMEKDR